MSNSMGKAAKILLAIGLTVAVFVMGSGLLLAASVARSGLVTVKVDEGDGRRIFIPVPAALVSVGLDVLPLMVERNACAKVRADLKEMGPALAGALRDLEDAPDAVLVDIQNDRETVRIVKEGRSLEIHVRDSTGTVVVSLPAHLLGRIAREIA